MKRVSKCSHPENMGSCTWDMCPRGFIKSDWEDLVSGEYHKSGVPCFYIRSNKWQPKTVGVESK